MEDAIALAESFQQNTNVQEALTHFTATRRPVIHDYQAAAFESMVWFENAAQYMHLSPLELAFTLMTRSGRVSYDDLKRRDPEFIRDMKPSNRSSRQDAGDNLWLLLHTAPACCYCPAPIPTRWFQATPAIINSRNPRFIQINTVP